MSEKDFSILWNKTLKNIKSDANFKEISYEFKNNFIEYIELNSNNFLTQYIVNIQKNKPNDLDCLQELCERFSELEINVDFEQITNFIKGCNNLQNILQNIIFNNLNIIESGDVETIIDNNLCLQFIEVYCALFDINLNNAEINDEDLLIKAIETYQPDKLFSLHLSSCYKNLFKKEEFSEKVKKYAIEENYNQPITDKIIRTLDIYNSEFVADEELNKFIYLKYGYYNDFYFSLDTIANILEIANSTVINLYKKSLILAKEVSNSYIKKFKYDKK